MKHNKPLLIPINPEQLIVYDCRMDNKKFEGEKPCCKYVKKIAYFNIPFLGIIHLHVNYCFFCGEKLKR